MPRSVRKIWELPVARAFSTTGAMSQGARNWPFLMFTGLPVLAAATTRSVWRHKKAGICKTSRTSAAGATSLTWCTSESTGSPTSAFTRARISRPVFQPRPPEGSQRSAVGLVVGGLEDEGEGQLSGVLLEGAGDVQGQRRVLDDAGPGDHDQVALAPIVNDHSRPVICASCIVSK